MLILLHGPNSFASRQKLNNLTEQFKRQRDPNGNNVVFLDGEKLTIDELNSKTATQSLLAEKRLIIVSDLFSHKKEDLFKNLLVYLENFAKHNDNSIIFYEGLELDSIKFGKKKLTVARKKLFEFLSKQKYSEKFFNLNSTQLQQWLESILATYKVRADKRDLQNLLTTVGDDQWLLNGEINKLIHFALAQNKDKIDASDIKTLTNTGISDNIFALTDAISNNNQALFFALLEDQVDTGTSAQQIINMLIRQFKIILQIKEMLLMEKNLNEIVAETKLHPFVIKKTAAQTRNFNINYLKNTVASLVDIDYKIKTGRINNSLTALNLLFIK